VEEACRRGPRGTKKRRGRSPRTSGCDAYAHRMIWEATRIWLEYKRVSRTHAGGGLAHLWVRGACPHDDLVDSPLVVFVLGDERLVGAEHDAVAHVGIVEGPIGKLV
jgi:hypothetical protein